jgi:hypothetical protein
MINYPSDMSTKVLPPPTPEVVEQLVARIATAAAQSVTLSEQLGGGVTTTGLTTDKVFLSLTAALRHIENANLELKDGIAKRAEGGLPVLARAQQHNAGGIYTTAS